jgi:cell division protein FtsN
MKRADLTGRSSVVYIGKGIIILSLVVTVSLGFILGFFIGKNYRPQAENQVLKSIADVEDSQNNLSGKQETLNTELEKADEASLSEEVNAEAEDKTRIAIHTDILQQPSQSVKPIATRKYTVQVGAFRDFPEAESLKSELSKKGYDAAVVTFKTKKQEILYKVMVGAFGTREEAEQFSLKIRKNDGLKPFVTFRTD